MNHLEEAKGIIDLAQGDMSFEGATSFATLAQAHATIALVEALQEQNDRLDWIAQHLGRAAEFTEHQYTVLGRISDTLNKMQGRMP